MNPVQTDGRDIDPALATLTGEASHQKTERVDRHLEAMAQVWEQIPDPDTTYYDRPLLQQPVWKPYIPIYFYLGGAAGASLALGAAAQIAGSRRLDTMVRRAHWIGIIGSSVGSGLLILDLGRPSRFLHMLRVFRPTSPMNMGSWILAITPPAAITAGLFARRGGLAGTLAEVAGYVSGLSGLGLSTYTGVLLGNSAVPLWQESRKVLPFLFASSAVASAASIYDLLYEDRHATAITRSYGMVGRMAELASSFAMEHRASRVPQVGRPLKTGWSGRLWRGAGILTAASLGVMLLPKQNRRKRVIAGTLGTLGSLALRFAVAQAGIESAADPRATFHLQRSVGCRSSHPD